MRQRLLKNGWLPAWRTHSYIVYTKNNWMAMVNINTKAKEVKFKRLQKSLDNVMRLDDKEID